MSFRDKINSGVLHIQRRLAESNTERSTFQWAGAQFPCGATTDFTGIDLSTTGNPTNVTVAFLVRHADFPNSIPPQSGSKLTWNSRTYKVDERGVRDLHGGAAWLYCVDWNSR